MRELAYDAIRSATLTRRFRGYDRQETEGLLARVAESYEKVHAERVRLSEKVASLRAEEQEREARSRTELDRLNKQLGDRDRQIADLETKSRGWSRSSRNSSKTSRACGWSSRTRARCMR